MRLRRRAEAPPPEDWWDKAQVVDVQRSRLEPATVEVAVVMRVPDGRFVHRRMRCSGPDLRSGVRSLCDNDPAALAHARDPAAPRLVRDEYFADADEALRAAEQQQPYAHPDAWRSPETIVDEDFDDKVAPEAKRLGRLAGLVVAGAFLVVFVALMIGGGRLVIRYPWLGGNGANTGEDVLVLVAIFAAGTTAYLVADVLGDRTVRKEKARTLQPGPQDYPVSVPPFDPPGVDLGARGAARGDDRPRRRPNWVAMQGVGVAIVVLALLPLLGDFAAEATARDLQAHGTPALSETIRVDVTGAPFWEWAPSSPTVRDVEVQLSGVHDGTWLALSGVGGVELLEEDKGTLWVDGWQTPSEATYYTAPLSVRYAIAPDGAIAVMAEDDIAYWIEEVDHTPDFAIAAFGVLLIVLSFVWQGVWTVRQRRRTRDEVVRLS